MCRASGNGHFACGKIATHRSRLALLEPSFCQNEGTGNAGLPVFVWWGVPVARLLPVRLHQLGFLVAVLLACFVVDSQGLGDVRPPTATHNDAARVSHELRLLVKSAEAEAQGAPFFVQIFAVESSKSHASSYVPASETTGQIGDSLVMSLPKGRYLLVVSSPGQARLVHEFDLSGALSLELQLERALTRAIKVMVGKDGELRPLLGATVLVGGATEAGAGPTTLPFGSSTDASGVARFNNTPHGPLLVRIFAPGYEPYRATSEGDLVVRLVTASSLQIVVTDQGQPQAEAEVVISGPSLWPPQSVNTLAHGQINVTGLSQGRYSLFARKGERISPLNEEIVIDEEASTQKVTLELGPGSFVIARVVRDEDERPLVGAKVSVGTSGLGQFRLYGRSDESGRVRLGPLLSASGVVQARAPGYVAVSLVFPQETATNDAPPAESSELVLRLVEAGTLTGRVVDEAGRPIAGATVEAVGSDLRKMPYSVTVNSAAVSDAHFDWAEDWSHDASRVVIPAGELGVMLGPVPPIPLSSVTATPGQSLTTDERGYFEIQEVPPGEGIVLGRHPDYMDGKSRVHVLAAGQELKTEIVLKRGEPFLGRLVDHRGFPVQSAAITALARGFERRVYSASDGNFELNAAPAELSLRVHSPDNPLRVLLVHDVKANERRTKLLIELPPPRADSVFTITDEKREPLGLSQVTVTSLDPQVPLRQTRFTEDQGTTSFEAIVGLRVRIEVEANGYVPVKWDTTAQATESRALGRSLRAEGLVTGVRGRQVAEGAVVTFVSGELRKVTVADELGRYQLLGLPPGPGLLSAKHDDFGQGSLSVVVKAGVADRPFEMPALDLSPSVQIEGRVEDAEGRAVAGALLASDRIGAFLVHKRGGLILGESDQDGEFSVAVQRADQLYLFGAALGVAYGFSDAIEPADRDVVDGVRVIVDHPDPAVAYEQGTALFSLDERDQRLLIYAVAEGSQAERAGLRAEDEVVSIDEVRPEDLHDARSLLSGPLGGQMRVVIKRAGSTMTFLVPRESFAR